MENPPPALPHWLQLRWPWVLPLFAVALLILAPIVAGYAVPTLDWVDYPTGVPTPSSASSESFAESFWPSRYSGVIAGAVTGLAIGIALFLAEVRVESNRSRRAHLDAVAGYFGNIERYARARNRADYIPMTAADAAPYGAALVEDESYAKPLFVWWELFPEYRMALGHVWFLRQSFFDFGVAARILDSAYDVAARHYLLSKAGAVDEEAVEAIRRYAIARILGADMDVIHVTTAGAMSSAALADAFDAIMQQPSYEHVATNYRNVLNAVQFALGALAPSVATIPDSSETDASTQEQTDSHAGG